MHVRTYVTNGNLWYVECYISGIIHLVVSRPVSLGTHCGMMIRCVIGTSVGALDVWTLKDSFRE